ncbi:MAG TPA: hypothetical protein VFZ00_09995 [Solirubrobacter sp.]|nr:hypothetical protein [Solirubrobacter sp.]
MTPDLERALRELEIEWPATPDIAAAVSARLQQPRRRRSWRIQLAYAAALLVLVFAVTMAASPDARSTVLRWLGISSVEIRKQPSRPLPAGLDLGPPATLDELRASGAPVLVPSALGDPDAGHLTTLPDGTEAASLVYADGPILVQTFRARATPFIEKTIGSGARVQRLTVDGATAYWIEGGHGFAYRSADNAGYEDQRLAGNTLLVDRDDGVLLRIEGRIDRSRAVEIARSVQ